MLNLIWAVDLLADVFFFLGYFSSKNSFEKPLSADEEAECIRLLREFGDRQAREKLINHNMRLVAHVTKKYSTSSIAQEDLLSIGTVGLIKGINTFAPEKGSKFASYVARCIDNEILMAIRSESKLLRNVYLDDVIGEDDEGNNITLTEIVGTQEDPTEEIELEIEAEKLSALMDKVLTEREKSIIKMRYGLNGSKKYTQNEIAEILKISRSYVSRIEKASVEKMAKAFDAIC